MPDPLKNLDKRIARRPIQVPKASWAYKIGDRHEPKDVNARLDEEEKKLLYDLPRIVGGGNMLNLGVGQGGSVILLAQGIKDRQLSGHVWGVEVKRARVDRSRGNAVKAGVEEYVTICRGTTNGLADKFQKSGRKYSVIFIDAGHSYEDAKNDWLNYSPLLARGGIIAFHDTHMKTVDKVLHDYVSGEWAAVFWIESIKAYKRIEELKCQII